MKTTGTTVFIWLFMAFVTFSSIKLYLEKARDNNRNIENVAALQKENQYFKDINGNQAVKIQALTLTAAELRRTIPQVIEDIRALNIRPALVNNYTTAAASTTAQIVTTLKDSIIFDTVRVSRIDYKSKWFDISGMIRGEVATLEAHSRDSINVINYQGKRTRRLLFIRVGPRSNETVIVSKNPGSTISIEKSIFIKK